MLAEHCALMHSFFFFFFSETARVCAYWSMSANKTGYGNLIKSSYLCVSYFIVHVPQVSTYQGGKMKMVIL